MAIVISILMVIVGVVTMLSLPTAQFPNIVPTGNPECRRPIPGRRRPDLEQSVATPIEQQITGVDNMNYMYSINANNGQMTLTVDFDVEHRPEHRPDPGADARQPGELAAAQRRSTQPASRCSNRTSRR